jgi:hypothetical protein
MEEKGFTAELQVNSAGRPADLLSNLTCSAVVL